MRRATGIGITARRLIPGPLWVTMTATSIDYGQWQRTWDRLTLIKSSICERVRDYKE